MRKIIRVISLALVMGFILLSACSAKNQLVQTPNSASPSLTLTDSSTATPTPSPSATITPTLAPLHPYPTKQVLLQFYDVGNRDTYFDGMYKDENIYKRTLWALYSDGQIIFTGKHYAQTVLSESEIKTLFNKLHSLGFYELESNQKHDPTDQLYDFKGKYERSYDGLKLCLEDTTSEGRTLCVSYENLQYAVPEMQNTIKFLHNYRPSGLTAYVPDRILLYIENWHDDKYVDTDQTSIPWEEDFPKLGTTAHYLYVEGKYAGEIYKLFNGDYLKFFSSNGNEYTLFVDVILPQIDTTYDSFE